MLTLTNITKEFETKSLYNGLSFKIKKNDFFAILGDSGSGKSTLLNIICFFDYITKGEYYFEKTLITKKNTVKQSRIRNERFGFIFQNYNLLDGYTGIQNIMLPFLYSRKKVDQKWLSYLIKKLQIEAVLDQNITILSGGEKQRIAIARALITKPDIIVADEPTGNLDQNNADYVINILKELHQSGNTIIFVTHSDRYNSYFTNFINLNHLKGNNHE